MNTTTGKDAGSGGRNAGPPAFPIGMADGMSLRDWFAGQALATNLYMDPKEAADNAYAVADAMLAARGKT